MDIITNNKLRILKLICIIDSNKIRTFFDNNIQYSFNNYHIKDFVEHDLNINNYNDYVNYKNTQKIPLTHKLEFFNLCHIFNYLDINKINVLLEQLINLNNNLV